MRNKVNNYLFKDFILIDKEFDNNYLVSENDLIKVYEYNNEINIYIIRNIEKLSFDNIFKLNPIMIYCRKLNNNDILNKEVLFKLKDIYMFSII